MNIISSTFRKSWATAVSAFIAAAPHIAVAQEASAPIAEPTLRQYVPETVSPEARVALTQWGLPRPPMVYPAPNDLAAWKTFRVKPYDFPPRGAEIFRQMQQAAIERYKPTLAEDNLGGVPVLDLKPAGWKDNHKVLVYIHGGAYVFGSLATAPSSAAPVADSTGLRVICVGYTLAPEAKWNQVTDQVVAVLQALQKRGYTMKDIGVFGDSAGGGLTAGAVLKMRDKGLGMPAALVLWSPWADVTSSGDTNRTLRDADPILVGEAWLKIPAEAYANPEDQKNPYVSPVYGDYSKGFPPTLIQGGTREILLSDFVRQYRAVDDAGGVVVLDLYEGMPHVFQVMIANSPEARRALEKTADFFARYLGYRRIPK